ncbi:hypothetical protein L804_00608 [Cryptococcus deuterogattii 2001/935-1]|nr:hypothetical protein L804_00608 [Cryptococcus deuterogattii 2001/935-1]
MSGDTGGGLGVTNVSLEAFELFLRSGRDDGWETEEDESNGHESKKSRSKRSVDSLQLRNKLKLLASGKSHMLFLGNDGILGSAYVFNIVTACALMVEPVPDAKPLVRKKDGQLLRQFWMTLRDYSQHTFHDHPEHPRRDLLGLQHPYISLNQVPCPLSLHSHCRLALKPSPNEVRTKILLDQMRQYRSSAFDGKMIVVGVESGSHIFTFWVGIGGARHLSESDVHDSGLSVLFAIYIRRFPTAQQFNSTYMNNFIGCLCEGQTYTGALGNETITGSAGICASCQTTPALIQKNIQNFLQLCSVQSTNGTASNSTAFRPQGYETAEDTSKDAVVGKGVQTLVNNATWLCWMGTFLTAFFSGTVIL